MVMRAVRCNWWILMGNPFIIDGDIGGLRKFYNEFLI
jgi:hypothetical protein